MLQEKSVAQISRRCLVKKHLYVNFHVIVIQRWISLIRFYQIKNITHILLGKIVVILVQCVVIVLHF